MDETFYVYKHVNPDTEEVFYIGCGNRLRPYDFSSHSRNTSYKKYVEETLKEKLPSVVIVGAFKDMSKALKVEAEQIANAYDSGEPLTNKVHLKYEKVVTIERPDYSAPINEVVRLIRKQSGLSQTELANLAGVSLNFLSQLEQGKDTVKLSHVTKVLDTLGLEIGFNNKRKQKDEPKKSKTKV